MAKVTETRVKITLTDAMSGPLRNIQGNLISTNSAANSLFGTFKSYASIGAAAMAGAAGFNSLSNSIGEAFGKAVSFNKQMETESIGMAGILTSMTQIEGRTLSWNEALGISKGIMKDLNADAMRTAATSEELISTFRALLGPGLGAGMNLEQIKDFTTVGVNAVKSLGLEGRQLVQELRDLVQGGIQPASSTLATALGLKDKDIKAAKESSEGLYVFLMKRIAGFQKAAEATPQTLAGMQAQLSEGMTLGLAQGIQPIMDEYKNVLQAVNDVLIDQSTFKVSEDFVNNVRETSEHVANMAQGVQKIAGFAGKIGAPFAGIAGDGLALAADNVDKIAIGVAAWKFAGAVNDIGKVKSATDVAYQSQGLLNSAVQKYKDFWNQSAQGGQLLVQAEMQAALNAASNAVRANNQISASAKQRGIIEKGVAKLTESGHLQLAARLQDLSAKYERLGLDAQTAGKLQIAAAKQAAKGNAELTTEIIRQQEAHVQNALATQKVAEKAQLKRNTYLGMTSALASVGMLTMQVADEENTLAQEFGEGAFQAGIFLQSIVALTDALKTLKLTSAGAFGLVAAGVAAIGYGAYEKYKHAESGGEFGYDELGNVYMKAAPGSEADHTAQKMQQRRQAEALKVAAEKAQQLDNKFPPGTTETSETEKAKRRYEKSANQIAELSKELNRRVLEATGSSYDVQMAEIAEKIEKMKSKVRTAMLEGVDVSGIIGTGFDDPNSPLAKLEELLKAQVGRDMFTDLHNEAMNYYAALEEAGQLSSYNADARRVQELESYKSHLQQMLSADNINTAERLRLQEEYAAAVQELQKAQATDIQASWTNTLDYIKNYQFDQLATMKSGVDEMMSTFTNFGQNMLTEQKSFNDRMDDLFKDLANSIMNTMMKVIMQGLVMRAITGIFGGGGSSNIAFTSDASWNPGWVTPHANGGVASGWSLVGERGPELVNFTQPGRVYTAEQTSKALGGNGLEYVKVIIENKSGTPVKATSTNQRFDGRGMVLGVVIDAVRNNEGGINNILKGALRP